MHHEDRVGILIVNGGRDPRSGKWIKFCLQEILRITEWPNFHIYVWNNNIDDGEVVAFLETLGSLSVFHADAAESLAHPHAVPLQRLYERPETKAAVISSPWTATPIHWIPPGFELWFRL